MNHNSGGLAEPDFSMLRPGVATDLRLIRAIADYLPQLVWSCLPDGHCDYLSRQWVEFTGVAEAEHHGSGWLNSIHPEDQARTRATWEAFVAGRGEYDVDYRLRRHDGRYLWFKTRGSLVRDDDGTPLRVLGTTTEIDAQKRAEEHVREIDERAAFVRRASGVGFWYCDLPFDVLEWDATVKEHFHLPPHAQVTIETFFERIHPDDREPTRQAIERSIARREGYDVHYRTVHPESGAEKWVRAIGRTFYAADGKPRRFDGITLDVTEQRRAEDSVRAREEQLRLITDTVPALIAFIDADLRYRFANRQYEVWFGHRREDVEGRTMKEVLGADALVQLAPYVARALAGEHVEFETQVAYCTGNRQIHAAYVPTYHAEQVTGFFSLVTDVTERVVAQQQLQVSEERFRAFMDNSPAAAWITDVHGRLRYVSAAYSRLFHLPARDIVGAAPEDLFAEEFAREYLGNIRRVAESGQPLETIERAPRPDGTTGQFLVYKFPLPGGESIGGVAIDVTERLQAEEQLRDADRKKDDFLALLAHELRNPLAPLRNGLEVLRLAGVSGELAEEARGIMERQLGHMVRLIDDLLDISRISRNKMELRLERVALAEVVASALETVRPLVDAAGHTLTVELPAEAVQLDADLTRLAQVFANLLSNAAKYTEHRGRIWLTAQINADEVEIAVRDTGIGIPPEALPLIFDMFSQVDRSLERSSGGLGIGLALVKGIVEMHGGRVSGMSDGPGQGSTFTVILPQAPAAPPLQAIREGTLPAGMKGRSCRILVVDDNRDSAHSLAAMLRLLGHEVQTADDGAQAVAAAQAFQPSLILMDVGMPRLSGYDATRRIRQSAWGKDVKVVAVTGWGQEGDRALSQQAGCNFHLVKPVQLSDLLPFLVGGNDS